MKNSCPRLALNSHRLALDLIHFERVQNFHESREFSHALPELMMVDENFYELL